jgi:purine-binding chemotaxis protein CheW
VSGLANPAERAGAQWERLARRAARRSEARAEAFDRQQLLCVSIDGSRYALRVERVRQIVRVRPIAAVPRVPRAVRGVILLRGEILQVIDMRRRLGSTPTEPTRSSRIVIVYGGDGQAAGLLVDAVTEVLSVTEEALRRDSGQGDMVEALCDRDSEFVSLLDLDRVLEIDGER